VPSAGIEQNVLVLNLAVNIVTSRP